MTTENNEPHKLQKILWIFTILAIVCGGIWAVFVFIIDRPEPLPEVIRVTGWKQNASEVNTFANQLSNASGIKCEVALTDAPPKNADGGIRVINSIFVDPKDKKSKKAGEKIAPKCKELWKRGEWDSHEQALAEKDAFVAIELVPFAYSIPTQEVSIDAKNPQWTHVVSLKAKETGVFRASGNWTYAGGQPMYGPAGNKNLPQAPPYSHGDRGTFTGELIIKWGGNKRGYRSMVGEHPNTEFKITGPADVQMVFNDDPVTEDGKRYEDNRGSMKIEFHRVVSP
ncbi:MAG: hypothetical protein P1U58_18055 [Verrucomicrobiales bacterium]|nr:hypothetical protein [Verrucomicrobiales bacterium]